MPTVHRHVTALEFERGATHLDRGRGGVIYNGVRYDEVMQDPVTGGFRLTRFTSGWQEPFVAYTPETGPAVGRRPAENFLDRYGVSVLGSQSGRWSRPGPAQTYSATMRDVSRQVRAEVQPFRDRALDIAYDELERLSITKMEMISKLYGGPIGGMFYDFETNSWISTRDKPQPKRMLGDTAIVYDAPIGPRANFKRKAKKTVDVEDESFDTIAANILREIEIVDVFSALESTL